LAATLIQPWAPTESIGRVIPSSPESTENSSSRVRLIISDIWFMSPLAAL